MAVYSLKRKNFSKEKGEEKKDSKYNKKAAIVTGTGAGLITGVGAYISDKKAPERLGKAINKGKITKAEANKILDNMVEKGYLKRHGGKIAIATAAGTILGATRDIRKPIKVFKNKEEK